MWYVYIARCSDGSLYTGITTSPQVRFERHNKGRGSKYVRARGTATLIYMETWRNRSEAQRREREIKSWGRHKKLALVTESSLSLRPRDSGLRPAVDGRLVPRLWGYMAVASGVRFAFGEASRRPAAPCNSQVVENV